VTSEFQILNVKIYLWVFTFNDCKVYSILFVFYSNIRKINIEVVSHSHIGISVAGLKIDLAPE